MFDTILCKNGNTVNVSGSSILCSGPDTSVSGTYNYNATSRALFGPRGLVSNRCNSLEEAKGTVIGICGGRKF